MFRDRSGEDPCGTGRRGGRQRADTRDRHRRMVCHTLHAGHCDLGSQAVVAKLPAPVAMSMVRTNDDVCVQYRPVRQLLEPILVWNLRKVNRIVVDSIKVPVPPVRGGNTEFVCLPLEAWGPIPPSSHQIEVIIYDKKQPVSSKSLEL